MLTLYASCVVIALAMCTWYFLVDVRRSMVQTILLFVMVISNAGYLGLALQTNLEAAYICSKVYYFGACFFPYLFFLNICEICNIQLKKPVIIISSAFVFLVFLASCTVGYNKLFYDETELVFIKGITVLKRTYGPLHIFHPLTTGICFVGSITASIFTCIQNNKVVKSSMVVVIICEALAMLLYMLERSLSIPFDLTPTMYVILTTGLFIHMYKSDIYDVVRNKDVMNELFGQVGFISFDKNMKYMGANEYALSIFPDLKNTAVGTRIKNPPVELLYPIKCIKNFLSGNKNLPSYHDLEIPNIKKNMHVYEVKAYKLAHFGKHYAGVTLEIREITK